MARIIYVVARDKPKVFRELSRTYGGRPDVEVVLDRRQRQRRQFPSPTASDRRASDRRWWDVTAALRKLGWAMVRRLERPAEAAGAMVQSADKA